MCDHILKFCWISSQLNGSFVFFNSLLIDMFKLNNHCIDVRHSRGR
jgi:hypothetical protein